MNDRKDFDSIQDSEQDAREFARQAEQKSPSMARELLGFLYESRKWWLIPIIVALVMVGAIVILGGTAAAPFIYTLF